MAFVFVAMILLGALLLSLLFIYLFISSTVWCNVSFSDKTCFLQYKWCGLPDIFLCDHMKVTQVKANLLTSPQPSKEQTRLS